MTTPQPNTRPLRYTKHGRRMTPGEVTEAVGKKLTTLALARKLGKVDDLKARGILE